MSDWPEGDDIIAYAKYWRTSDKSTLTKEEIAGAKRVQDEINRMDD